jgi:hypothetical protein
MTAGRRASKSNTVYASSNARHDGGSDNSSTCKPIRGSRWWLPLLPRQRQHHGRKPDAPRHSISGGGRRFPIAGFSKLAAQNNEPHPPGKCPAHLANIARGPIEWIAADFGILPLLGKLRALCFNSPLPSAAGHMLLSQQEQRVLDLLVGGYTNAQIAKELLHGEWSKGISC